MERPYLFCHMLTSLDGKITGGYMETAQGEAAGNVFYELAFGKERFYQHQGWLSGRVTTDDNFIFYQKPDLDESAPAVPEGDYLAQPDFGMFYVSVDAYGRLGWKDAALHYADTTAHVVEVLTEQVSNAYRAFLRKKGISYIVTGKERLDYSLMLSKLKKHFHIETLMLGGRRYFELVAFASGALRRGQLGGCRGADGSADTPSVFRAKAGLSENHPIGFTLKEAKVMDGGSLWLRYTIN